MAAEGGISAQVAVNIGFEAEVAAKLVAAFKSTDADASGFVDNHEVRHSSDCSRHATKPEAPSGAPRPWRAHPWATLYTW